MQTNVWKIKNATERFLAQLHPSNLVNTIFCLVSNFAVHKLFRIYIIRKLFAVRFPYKYSKFGADMSIYPECNAWRHLFTYGWMVLYTVLFNAKVTQ